MSDEKKERERKIERQNGDKDEERVNEREWRQREDIERIESQKRGRYTRERNSEILTEWKQEGD